jgi:hemolysin activation/secretion protein
MRYKRSVLAMLAVLSASSWAQNIPDAGALMRQTEQMLRQDQMQRNAQMRSPLPPELVLNDATLVTVQRFKFNGNQRLTTDQLAALTAPFANRPLNQHDLQQLTHTISEAYRQIGWLVQAYIPRQDFKNTEMTLQIIESIPPNRSSQ